MGDVSRIPWRPFETSARSGKSQAGVGTKARESNLANAVSLANDFPGASKLRVDRLPDADGNYGTNEGGAVDTD